MSVSVTSPQVTYVGNGITTEYPFSFTILKATDLRVFVEDVLQTLDTHYTLDNNFTTVTFVTAPLNLDDIVIERNTQIERTTDYIEGGGLSSDTLDNDFDRIVMMVQEQEILGTGGNSGTGISTDAGGNNIINVADPVNLQDAATKNYVDTATPEINWQSDSYNIDTHQGWKLDPATGSAIFHSLSVRNNTGQVVFDVGGLDWGYVNNKPSNLVETYYQSIAPVSAFTGDYWIDTDDNKTYRYDGASWVIVQDSDIAQALLDAGTAQATADGKVVTYAQTTAPTADGVGDLWIDTNDGNRIYRWNGSSWIDYRDTTIATAQAQANTAITNAANAQSDATQAQADAATAQSTADGKVVTFYQNEPPTADGVGDLWIDTNDGNKLYRWDTTTWVAVQDTDISTAISNAGTAQATADGKIVSYYQDDAPTIGLTEGDLWVDTNDSNKLYRYNNITWVTAQDESIATAQAQAITATNNASTAQATADGKVVTFFQTGFPTAEGIGDLWIDTNDGNKLYRWNGSSWLSVQDGSISTAITDAATAQATADSKIVSFYQSTAPTAGMNDGDYWTDSDDNQLYRYDGTLWISIRDSTIQTAINDASNAVAIADGKILSFYQSTAPTAGMNDGDLWIDTDDGNRMYRYDGASWVDIQDGSVTQAQSDASNALSAASNAEATANGKVTTFVQITAPTAESVGDIWLDSDDNNKLYRWDGTTWLAYAQDSADWTKVYGIGRPDDGATAGATVGVNFNGQFNSGNISTYFASAAIGYAQIGSVKLTGNNFTINEGITTSGITMDGNAIKVYDALGNLRVQLGNLLV